MDTPWIVHRPPATIALAGSVLLGSLGVSIVTVAMPALAAAFAEPVAQVQWVVIAYLLAATLTVVIAGKLGDTIGHRRVLLLGLVIFAVASVACALAPTLGALAAARAVQGIGAAVLMTLPMSILKETVVQERLGSAMGLLGTMSAVGTALGPSLGGLVLSGLGWRAVFAPLAVLGALTLLAAVITIPANTARTSDKTARMDWPGAILLAVALCAYSLLMSMGGGDLASTSMLLVGTVIAFIAFVAVESRAASPLVPLSAISCRTAASALTTNLIMSTVMMTTLVVGPFYLSLSLGLDDSVVGAVMSVGPITAALTGIAAGRAVDKYGNQTVMVAGLIEASIGFISLALIPRYLGVSGVVLSLIILTPGFQMFLAANSTALMAAAPHDQRGVLSGLLGLSRNLGFVTGASAMATLFTFAVGHADVLAAGGGAVANGFSGTFLAASGLTLVALIGAILGRSRRTADVEE